MKIYFQPLTDKNQVEVHYVVEVVKEEKHRILWPPLSRWFLSLISLNRGESLDLDEIVGVEKNAYKVTECLRTNMVLQLILPLHRVR